MAKIKKDTKIVKKVQRYKGTKNQAQFWLQSKFPKFVKEIPSAIKPRLENKLTTFRSFARPLAARTSRWGAPSGVALVILLTFIFFFSGRNDFQQLKERLVRNPNDFEAHLLLAEKFLANNQFTEAERALLLAQKIYNLQFSRRRQSLWQRTAIGNSEDRVLGQKTPEKLNELWQEKHDLDPQDIRRLIAGWEKIVAEKPGYRDGLLQLAALHFKLYENDRAKEYLNQTLAIDPNYEPAQELEKMIQ